MSDLKAALQAVGLRGSLTRLTAQQLRKKVDKAKAGGTPLKTRGCEASVDVVEPVLLRFEQYVSSMSDSLELAPKSMVKKRKAQHKDPANEQQIGDPESDIVPNGQPQKRLKSETQTSPVSPLIREEKRKLAIQSWPLLEALQVRHFGKESIGAFEQVRLLFVRNKAMWLERTGGGYDTAEYFTWAKAKASTSQSSQLPAQLGVFRQAIDRQKHGDQDTHDEEPIDLRASPDEALLDSSFVYPTGDYKSEMLSEELIEKMKRSLAERRPPRFLYRASSWEGKKHTSGYDSLTLHVPAAHMHHDEKCHDSIYEIPNGLFELGEMLGRRFLWQDRRRDEMLSWTSSLLFAIVHATGRVAKGQRHVVIHVIDTTKVTTIDGRPVDFHFAPDLIRILDIQSWPGWNGTWDRKNLRQPWYTHEWITHHVVKSPKEHSFEAKIKSLVDMGLYGFVPSLRTSEEDDMRSLYHRCTQVRSIEHRSESPKQPLTLEELVTAKRLASCFLVRVDARGRDTPEPPLRIFLDFLGLVARPKGEVEFKDWILRRYPGNVSDTGCSLRVADIGVAHQTDTADCVGKIQAADGLDAPLVANNLPEVAQMLKLAREVSAIQGIQDPIHPVRIWMADPDFDWHCEWLKPEVKKIAIKETRSRKTHRGLLKLLNAPSTDQTKSVLLDDQSTVIQTRDEESHAGQIRQSHARSSEQFQPDEDADLAPLQGDTDAEEDVTSQFDSPTSESGEIDQVEGDEVDFDNGWTFGPLTTDRNSDHRDASPPSRFDAVVDGVEVMDSEDGYVSVE